MDLRRRNIKGPGRGVATARANAGARRPQTRGARGLKPKCSRLSGLTPAMPALSSQDADSVEISLTEDRTLAAPRRLTASHSVGMRRRQPKVVVGARRG